MRNAGAFTLIEILVVVSILGILMAAAIPTFNSFNKTQILLQGVKNIKSDIRTVQNFSLSGTEGKVWGLHFSTSSGIYKYFKCAPSAPLGYFLAVANTDCVSAKDIEMSPSVRITKLNDLTSDLDVAFESVTGNVSAYQNGTLLTVYPLVVTLDFSSGAASPKTVSITATGGVYE